jgi:hypothetical protein
MERRKGCGRGPFSYYSFLFTLDSNEYSVTDFIAVFQDCVLFDS